MRGRERGREISEVEQIDSQPEVEFATKAIHNLYLHSNDSIVQTLQHRKKKEFFGGPGGRKDALKHNRFNDFRALH